MAQRGQLAEQVYETVKYRLRSGDYRAGERISVAGLANELGISRQPVMDGLRRLATQRFLEIIPQVGVKVVVTERREMQDFYRMLAAMESVCATLAAERADARRGQVGSGERSEKIRTYNFPQSRVTDHRAGVTLHRLESVLEGDLEELLDAVHLHMAAEAEKQALAP